VQPGQPVSITVDALPDEKFGGVVASVSPASGAVFSLLPPDNATGNFTKIVQRLPVRIQVAADVAERGALRPGMSVIAAVNTRAAAATSPASQPPAAQTRTAAD
jgi:membrane fusion protein (multidrug efflux system)